MASWMWRGDESFIEMISRKEEESVPLLENIAESTTGWATGLSPQHVIGYLLDFYADFFSLFLVTCVIVSTLVDTAGHRSRRLLQSTPGNLRRDFLWRSAPASFAVAMHPPAAAHSRRRRRSRFSSAETAPSPSDASKSAAPPVATFTTTGYDSAAAQTPRQFSKLVPRPLPPSNFAVKPEPPTNSLSFPTLTTSAKRRRPRPLAVAPSAFGSGFDSDTSSDSASASLPPSKRRLLPTEFSNPDPEAVIMENKPPSPDDDADPLDDFMQRMATTDSARPRRPRAVTTSGDDGSSDGGASLSDGEGASRKKLGSKPRGAPRRAVYQKLDHSKIDYPPFQKALYIEVPELTKMSHAEVAKLRRELGNIRIRGKRCPRPMTDFSQCGLSSAVLDVLRRAGYEKPTPIQAQGIPCLMSGRDVIGIARTGSGKTLAFLLPVLRHIALQPRAGPGEGPAAIVVAPTRELAIQIYGEAKKFSKAVQVKSVCAYGGSGVKDQIAELKRGADIVICTPGRMIDLLGMNSGRITNLRRVTIVVLDEADRMFDMGFEPQLTRIVENVRPDRQTVMFSATFPAQVERLARKVLKQPVEIMVGGNSVAAATIDQHVEVRGEDSKFLRLLELLGKWYEVGSTLVFVDRQDNADRIFRELSKARYRCLSLHGGMDQADRDSAIVDFKNGVVKVLVATSVAARGLDVKNLTLVVNFDVPSHYEDYVHRVGRTGRAGKSGTAYTFITPEQEAFAPDLVKALQLSARAVAEQEAPIGDKDLAEKAADEAAEAVVPEKLRKLADSFELKRKAGIVKHGASSGYRGKGFSFENNDDYDAAKIAIRKMQAKQYGIEDDVVDDELVDDKRGESNMSAADEDDDDDEDSDGIVEITVAPKATGLARNNGNATASDKKSRTSQASNKELTPAQIEIMLSEAVKKAEADADKQKLSDDARRAKIAQAKATVLTIAALQNKSAKQQGLATPTAILLPKSTSTEKSKTAEVSAAAAAAAAISAKLGGAVVSLDRQGADTALAGQTDIAESGTRFAGELEINDYQQHARWQVTRKGSLSDVEEFTGCVITTRGNFYPVGRNPPAGERKLHFLIEGPSRRAVKTARRDIRQKLEEAASGFRPSDNQYSKYSVV